MEVLKESQNYIKLLLTSEDWLMERILSYARKNHFTKYTSTLQEAWRMSVSGITESLLLAVKTFGLQPPELHPEDNFEADPITLFGRIEAKKHRTRGVSLVMFLSLMKYYRQAYLDLFDDQIPKEKMRMRFSLFTERCFDRIELGYISEWTAISRDEKVEELQSSNRDITNEKNKYLTVFESLFTPIILLDEKNQIINFNLAAARLFKDIKIAGSLYYNDEVSSSSQKILSERIGELVDSHKNEQAFKLDIETLQGKKHYRVLLKKSLDISERYRGTIVMLQDETEQYISQERLKEAKLKAEEADRLKTSFLANMSHEIRTPMNAIVGFTELMLNENYHYSEKKDFLKLIRNSSRDLLHIIEDIIDVAKLESKQLKIKYKACRIYDILVDLRTMFTETIRRYGTQDDIRLELQINEQDRDLVIYTDGERLKQVITNFLSNAVKFTAKGYIEFGYRMINESELLFFVRDSGSGVPEEMKAKIFDRFFQMEEHQGKNLGGAGLGLAICKNIVTLLGGEIWVESVPGRGSEFCFSLPFHKVTENIREIKPVVKKPERKSLNLGTKCILIAEDDDTNYLFLEQILAKTGAELIRAVNGLEAINLTESREKIDLILMDIKMPQVDGIQAAKYITSIRPDIPIIAQTAFAMEGDKTRCLQAGCAAYITKPIEHHKLFLLLERYITSKSLAGESIM